MNRYNKDLQRSARWEKAFDLICLCVVVFGIVRCSQPDMVPAAVQALSNAKEKTEQCTKASADVTVCTAVPK